MLQNYIKMVCCLGSLNVHATILMQVETVLLCEYCHMLFRNIKYRRLQI